MGMMHTYVGCVLLGIIIIILLIDIANFTEENEQHRGYYLNTLKVFFDKGLLPDTI